MVRYIQYNCKKCGNLLESPTSMLGQEDQCPICKNICILHEQKKQYSKLLIISSGAAIVLIIVTLFFLARGELNTPTDVSISNEGTNNLPKIKRVKI